jgi:hypothetical protein
MNKQKSNYEQEREEILKEFCNMNDEDISAVKEAGAV